MVPPWASRCTWLVGLDICWTRERLAHHGLPHSPVCILCDQEQESIHHLLVGCVLSRIVWHDIFHSCRLTIAPPDGSSSLFDWWTRAVQSSPPSHRKAIGMLSALISWAIWRHRNACVFDGATPSHAHLVSYIQEEARTLPKAGARGLSNIIPVIQTSLTSGLSNPFFSLLIASPLAPERVCYVRTATMYFLPPYQWNDTHHAYSGKKVMSALHKFIFIILQSLFCGPTCQCLCPFFICKILHCFRQWTLRSTHCK